MKSLIVLFTISLCFHIQAEYKKVGQALLEYSIFKIDVYTITYFVDQKNKKLELVYETDVKKKYSIKGWQEGLKFYSDAKYKKAITWIEDNTIDMNEGEKFTIALENDILYLKKQGKVIAQSSDPIIKKLAFEPWLGVEPVSAELKSKLLNKQH